jgi:fido (protein-threonine AMPylation protein)
LVAIHVFPNGNGRHARIMADLLFHSLSGQRLEWGRDALNVDGDARARYLSALRAADAGDLGPLLQFVTVER